MPARPVARQRSDEAEHDIGDQNGSRVVAAGPGRRRREERQQPSVQDAQRVHRVADDVELRRTAARFAAQRRSARPGVRRGLVIGSAGP